jgi:hypothetical protein
VLCLDETNNQFDSTVEFVVDRRTGGSYMIILEVRSDEGPTLFIIADP